MSTELAWNRWCQNGIISAPRFVPFLSHPELVIGYVETNLTWRLLKGVFFSIDLDLDHVW